MKIPIHPWSVSACIALLALALAGNAADAGLEFSHTTIDVGEVRSGVPLSHRFLFVNRGAAAAEIIEVKAACGCMTPVLSRKHLGPGEEGDLQLEVNTLSQASGPQDWWVRLQWRSDGKDQQTTLHLLARLTAEIGVEPASMVIYADREVDQLLTLTDTRPQPLAVKGVSATAACLKSSVGETVRNKDGQWSIPIRLRFDGKIADGRYQEMLNICTSDPFYPELRVPVTLVKETASKVTAAPTFLTIPVALGQPIPSKIILVRNSGDEQVEIESVTADDPAIHCTWAPGPENHATVRLTVDRRQLRSERLLDSLRIQLRKPVVRTLTVPIEFSPDSGR